MDDEPDMRMLMRMTLTLDGVCDVVAEAENGPAAFQAWQLHRPDVIVMDMRMPGETGLEAARRILRIDPAARVVMCSAYMDAHDVRDAESAGVAACLAKSEIDRLPGVVQAAVCAA